MRRYALLIVCSLLLGALHAEGAPLSGSVEWRYGQYRAESDGERVTEASHFTQQYSLLYTKQGKIVNGRGGKWDVALGAEWTAVDTEVNGADINLQTEKIFYRGDLLLAPGGLPFRLHLYSHDMHRTNLISDTILPRGGDQTGIISEAILAPRIVTDFSNGQHVISGGTLLVGIRNGSYRGRYRDLLSQFPRLLADYKQETVRNLESRLPQHFRLRDLAFVSLNKKDNWFHYRFTDFVDYLNPANDYTEKRFILGTVDHNLTRQWINLTNWIKISVDATQTRIERPTVIVSNGSPTSVVPNTDRFDLNLFTVAQRTRYSASANPAFHRITETRDGVKGGYLDKEFEFPLFLQGELGRDTAWRFRFLGTSSEQAFLTRDAEFTEDILYASTRVETFRQGRYVLAPQFEAERKQGESVDGYAVRAGVEFFSNRIFKPRYELFGAYSLARFAGTAKDGLEVDFWESEAKGRIETSLTSRVRTGVEEALIFGTGTLDRVVTSSIAPRSDLGISRQQDGIQRRQGDVFRSRTTWFGEHSTARRLDNRIELVYDFLSTDTKTEDQFLLRHSLRYDRRQLLFTLANNLVIGDNPSVDGLERLINDSAVPASAKMSFLHSSSLRYLPSRAWEASAQLDYDWRDTDEGSTSKWRLNQKCVYSFFVINGLVRKLAEVTEEADYERYGGLDGRSQTAATLSLRGDYYPTHHLLFGTRLRYRTVTLPDLDEYLASLTAGLNFAKLTASVDYSYGLRTATAGTPERTEHRWEVKLKKIF